MRTPPPVIATGQVAPQTFTLEGGLSASLTLAIGLVVAIEGAVIHLWVASRSQAWAWAIAAVNVATLLWLWRDHKAASSARLLVTDVGAEILIGNRIRCFAPHETIASAEIATWRSVPDMAADYLRVHFKTLFEKVVQANEHAAQRHERRVDIGPPLVPNG